MWYTIYILSMFNYKIKCLNTKQNTNFHSSRPGGGMFVQSVQNIGIITPLSHLISRPITYYIQPYKLTVIVGFSGYYLPSISVLNDWIVDAVMSECHITDICLCVNRIAAVQADRWALQSSLFLSGEIIMIILTSPIITPSTTATF